MSSDAASRNPEVVPNAGSHSPHEPASLDLIRAYLQVSDVPCTDCGYNLRGISGERCPECGALLQEMFRWLPAHLRTDEDELARVRAYLKGRDVPCPNCRANLRDQSQATCANCAQPLTVWTLTPVGLPAKAAIGPVVTIVLLLTLIAAAWIGVLGVFSWFVP